MINKVVLVAGVQQSDSVIHISFLFQIIFPFRLLQNIEQSSLGSTVVHCWLSVSNIVVYTCQGEGNGNPLQYSCLENLVDRGAWWAAVHRVAQSQTRLKRLSMHACIGEGNGNPLQYSCLENPVDRGAWWAAVHGVAQSRTRLSDFTFTFHFHALEKEMATHSSILAWRIPWTEEPGGLLSIGLHRVGHD